MKINKKTLVVYILSVLVVVAIGIGAYNYYRTLKQPVSPVENAIPKDAFMFAELTNITSLWKNNAQSNEIWKALQQFGSFNDANNDLIFIDNLIQKNKSLQSVLESNKSYVSFHLTAKNKISLLYLINIPVTFNKSEIHSILKNTKEFVFNERKFDDVKIYEVKRNATATPFVYSVYKGVFMGSFNAALVEQAIMQLNSSSSINTDNDFTSVHATAGKKVDANLYLNYKNLQKVIAAYTFVDFQNDVAAVADIAKWSEQDVFIKNNMISLNGYTTAGSSNEGFVSIFKNQQPQLIKIPYFLPQRTVLFEDVCFDNYATYLGRTKNYLKANNKIAEYDGKIKQLNATLNLNIEDNFINWMGNEFAVAIVDGEGSIAENTYVICQANDISLADSCLSLIAKATKNREKNTLQVQGVLKTMLGKVCPDFKTTYYEVADNFVLFGCSKQAINNFKKSYSAGEVLAKSKDYLAFAENISEKSNIYGYINLAYATAFLQRSIAKESANDFSKINPFLKNFKAVSFQMNAGDKLFYTNINIKYTSADFKITETTPEVVPAKVETPVEAPDMKSGWQVNLDGAVVNRPYLVKSNIDDGKNILVADASNKVYLINKKGETLWKTSVDGKVLGEIYEVDFFKNNKSQYLFNTENTIYLIDAKGNKVGNYPIKLSQKATAGICLIDYEKKREYRMVLPCADKKVYYYNIKGEKVTDWKLPVLKAVAETSPQHIIFNGKDNIIVTDKNGATYYYDRKGAEKIKLKTAFVKNQDSKFYSDGKYLLTTDKSGCVYFISADGKVDTKVVKKLSGSHCFVYEHFNNDDKKDFIFLANNELNVCKKDGKVQFSYKFNKTVSNKILVFNDTKKGAIFGVLSADAKQIYLFNKNGYITASSGFKGDSYFVVDRFIDKKQLNVIVGFGNKVLNFNLD